MPAPQEPPTSITIRVKVPPGHIAGSSVDEFNLGDFPANGRIGDIRNTIQRSIPPNPAPEQQRLLYAGRALVDDSQSLADALNLRRDTAQTEYVVHLLIKGDHGTGSAQTAGHGRIMNTPAAGALPPASTGGGVPQNMHAGAGAGHGMTGNMQAIAGRLAEQQRTAQIQHQQLMQRMMMEQQQRQNLQRQQAGNLRPPAAVAIPNMDGSTDQPAQAQTQPATGLQEGQTPSTGAANNATGTAPSQQLQPPHRPVSGQGFHMEGIGPNGQRFAIHQQTLNMPGMPFGAPGNFGLPQMPGMALPFPMPGMAQQNQPGGVPRPTGPTALDRARENIAEMRRMLNQLHDANNSNEESRSQISEIQERIQAVNSYIDPFNLGYRPAAGNQATPQPQPQPMAGQNGRPEFPSAQNMPGMQPTQPIGQPRAAQPGTSANPADVTCYLLSSPSGPQALVMSPQHGSFAGSLRANNQPTFGLLPGTRNAHLAPLPPSVSRMFHPPGQSPIPTPTQPAQPRNGQAQQQPGAQQPADPADPAAALAQQAAAAQAQPAEPQNPLQPILAHFWLLLRIMIFAYFVLGSNMGWRRPVALMLIGVGFWMIRMGVFGPGGVGRRWWEEIVNVGPAAPRPDPGQGEAQLQGQGGQQNAQQQGNPQARQGQLPLTPEQLAQRLLNQRDENLNRAPLHRLREQVRPLERALALFVASLWPGVGEAYVRRLERAERERNEAEVERRRVEEEERQRAEQEREKEDGEKMDAEAGESSGEKATGSRDHAEVVPEEENNTIAANGGEATTSGVVDGEQGR